MPQEITRKSKAMVNEKLNQNTPEVRKAISEVNKRKGVKSVKAILSKRTTAWLVSQ